MIDRVDCRNITGSYPGAEISLHTTTFSDSTHVVRINRDLPWLRWDVEVGARVQDALQGEEPSTQLDAFPNPHLMMLGAPTPAHEAFVERMLGKYQLSEELTIASLNLLRSAEAFSVFNNALRMRGQ